MQVVRLGKELGLAVLTTTAESTIIQGSWSGENLDRVIKLLRGQSIKEIRATLHRPSRSTVSELEVSVAQSG